MPVRPCRHVTVSIHAPPNRKERQIDSVVLTRGDVFQSTPLPTGRSDIEHVLDDHASPVSIHAPPNRKERREESIGST